MATGLSYMLRRGGVYWFRKKLPQDLAGIDAPQHVRAAVPEVVNPKSGRFKVEITGSLGTKDPKAAKRLHFLRVAAAAEAIEVAQRLLRDGPSAPQVPELPSPEEIEAEHLRKLLAYDDEEREGGDQRIGVQTNEERAALGLEPLGPTFGMPDIHFIAYGDALTHEAETLRAALAQRKVSAVAGDVRAVLNRYGQRYDPHDLTHFKVAMAVLKASAKAADLMLARQGGEDVPTPKSAATIGKGPKLSEAFSAWQEGSSARGGRNLAPNSIREAKLAVRLFTEWSGDKALGAITREDVRTFRTALERKPSRLPGKLKTLPLRKLLAADLKGLPTTHGNTVNKLLNILGAIVVRAEREGLTESVAGFSNPFKGVRSEVDRRQKESREPFDAADLKAIFGTPVFASGARPRGGGGEAAFWLPVLALLTGARQEELAQLRVCDVEKQTVVGSWFLDIDVSGGRSVKTASSRRKVPLHPELERIGFLRYREARAKEGPEAPLWPDLTSDVAGKRSAAFSKWFGRYLRLKAGVTNPRKVFHSFRHTFKRLARDVPLNEELHDALTGHAGGGGVGRSYGQGFGLKALADGMAKIEAPTSVRALRWDP